MLVKDLKDLLTNYDDNTEIIVGGRQVSGIRHDTGKITQPFGGFIPGKGKVSVLRFVGWEECADGEYREVIL